MSTRTNIVIRSGESRVVLYRHWDGYLAETGRDLHNKLVSAGGTYGSDDRFLRALLAEMNEATSYREATPVYELTDCLHGDIEYLYVVEFPRQGEATVGWSEVGFNDDEDAARAAIVQRPLAAFRADVNKAITEQNRRLLQLKQQQPAHFGDATPAELVSA